MSKSNIFLDKLKAKWDKGLFVCVGLDSDSSKIPTGKTIFEFNKWVIDQTHDLVCSYKINTAFYESQGLDGLKTLKQTIQYIHQNYPDVLVILDAKKGDIENTNTAYAKAIFDDLGADSTTVNPYLGKESLQPFLDRSDKGIFVLVKTSNPGAGEFQDLDVEGKLLYQVVAEYVSKWNTNGNVGVVVGATYPKELAEVRKIVGDMPILIPGVGSQGGDLQETIKSAVNREGDGIIIHSARSIIFSLNPRETTQTLHKQIQEALRS